MERSQRDQKMICLSTNDVRFIFLVYVVFAVLGLFLSVLMMANYFSTENKEVVSIICGMSMAAVGSSIFYSRKLYRACINDHFNFIGAEQNVESVTDLQRVGSKAYFLLRPLFSIAFALLICCLWRVGVAASGEGEPKMSAGFLYTSVLLGFISGFLAGRVLTGLEGYGAHRLEAMLAADDQ